MARRVRGHFLAVGGVCILELVEKQTPVHDQSDGSHPTAERKSMKNPTQETPIGKVWRRDFGPAMVTLASLLVLGTAVPAASAPPPQQYRFTTVDAPGNSGDGFQLTWISNDGLVIQQYVGGDGHSHTAALLSSGWTLIDVPGAANTGGTNPNSRGEVALSTWDDGFVNFHLAIWERGHYTYVPDSAFDGDVFQGAQGINDRGEVSAAVSNPDGSIFYGWVGDSRHHTVFSYPGSGYTIALMTNNSGTTVGEYVDAAGAGHGFIKNGNHFENLDYPGGTNTYGLSINNEGEIVGDYFLGHVHGFLLQRDKLTPFNVPGAIAESPYWINDHHVIAGSYRSPDNNWHGFIATPVGGGK
jgi:hypothetical protein